MKIFSIVGARPNFIKIDTELPQTIIHTGQHFDFEMSKVFFNGLKLPKPLINLECGNQIGKMLDTLKEILAVHQPDLVIVFGDTNSSLAGAIAAAHCNIPLAHIEAGLRSHRMDMPEEINRILIDRIAKIKLCPNEESKFNLLKEGIKDDVYVVGDPMLDTFMKMLPIEKGENYGKYILVTMHRNYNADSKEKMQEFFDALEQSCESFIFPMHPRTKMNLHGFGIKVPENVKVITPQPYKKIIQLLSDF